MTKINLRDYYPDFTIDYIIEVPDEVAEVIDSYGRAEAALLSAEISPPCANIPESESSRRVC
jgi:hypothetical protein